MKIGKISIYFTKNGNNYGWSRIRSFFDFFFPFKYRYFKENGVWYKQERIRAENSAFSPMDSNEVFLEFYTARALFGYWYYVLKGYQKKLKSFRLLKLSLPLGIILPIGYSFAIAFDSTTQVVQEGSVSSKTFSFTNTAGNYIIVSPNYADSTQGVSTITYNAVGLTSQVSAVDSYARSYIYDLSGPATGANNVVVTYAGTLAASNRGGVGAVSYSGVISSGAKDVTGTVDGFAGTQDLNITVTTNVANDWFFGACWWGGSGTITDNNGETSRWNTTPADNSVNNAGHDKSTTTAGAYSSKFHATVSNSGMATMIAFQPPAVAKKGGLIETLLFMGAG